MSKSSNPEKLLWVDLEMTGLDPENDRILEVGVIITDFNLKEIATYESVIFQKPEALNRMKTADWYEYIDGRRTKKGTVYDMATGNGLLERIKTGKPEEEVEEDVANFISNHFDKLAILAGNSIHQDRRFIRQWWPSVEKLLHYRMLDVTSYKILMQGKFGQEFKKPDEHRALDDIRGSIEEFGYYLRKLPELLKTSK